MPHVAKVIEKKQLSDGAIAIRLRCCGDPSTDSIATLYVKADTDVAAWAAKEKTRVQDAHARMLAAHVALDSLLEKV
jgi:hypothetical protein